MTTTELANAVGGDNNPRMKMMLAELRSNEEGRTC